MIERLEGELLEVGPEHLLINIGGIGLRVLVPKSVSEGMRPGTRVTLLTRLVVRDGEPQLYGFQSADERACFDGLLSVSGVGPRIGLAVLSFMEPEKLALEIERGSTTRLLAVPGVGKKLAARILLELKGRISVGAGPAVEGGVPDIGSDVAIEALRALAALGYSPAVSREAVRAALRDNPEPPALDQLLRDVLIGLSRSR